MRIVLAHGASGSAASMQPHVDGLRRRGIDALAIDLPVRRAETALVAYRSAAGLEAPDAPTTVIGGHSYGGRVASLVAADAEVAVGLVLLSYPLHRPGEPAWQERSVHWPRIRVPVLLLSGESDPFARIDLLRNAVEARLPDAELVTYPGLGHMLKPVLEDVLDRIAVFVNRR